MKAMYHLAVLDLIKRQQGIALSVQTFQIYESYLAWQRRPKPLFYATLIGGFSEAHVVADCFVSPHRLLESTNVVVRRFTCRIVGRLAFHSSTRGAVVALEPCKRLVALLMDSDAGVIAHASYALVEMCHDSDGALAVLEAGALKFLEGLLYSHSTAVRRHVCFNLARLAMHYSTQGVVVAVQPCVRLVALLHDGNVGVLEGASYALSEVSCDFDGSRAVVEAGALALLDQLLGLKAPEVRQAGCWIVGELASHSSIRATVVATQPCGRLVALLGDDDVDVVKGSSCYALWHISNFSSKELCGVSRVGIRATFWTAAGGGDGAELRGRRCVGEGTVRAPARSLCMDLLIRRGNCVYWETSV
ncbi:armadillo-type protein [Mycena metata]|uniref:Vacuolar protein 8 n=1 Tax=Mycena metata TaxID=1033252 RepID=A0AAD7NAJ6_9AGAR|nr:armadillo-type protein [Mycena metata]